MAVVINTANRAGAGQWVRLVKQLIEAKGKNVVRFSHAAVVALQDTIRDSLRQLGENPQATLAQQIVDNSIKALPEYNFGVERLIESQHTENKQMKESLSGAVEKLKTSHDDEIAAASDVMNRLKRMRGMESLQQVRTQLDEAIDRVSTHSQKRQALDQDLLIRLTALSAGNAKTTSSPALLTTDPVTGLPSAASAEAYLEEIINKKAGAFLVVFQAERLDQINRRYGYAAGDQVLQVISQRVAVSLASEDTLFRWRGPAVLGVVERYCDLATLRSEVTRMSCSRFEHIMNINQRSVLLSLSVSCQVLPVGPMSTLEGVLHGINQFLAPQGSSM